MNPASLIGHAVELLKLVERTTQPADRIVERFFRDRRYLGAKDRRWISATLFGIIRHRRYIEALLEQYLIEHPNHQVLDEGPLRYLALCVVYLTTVGCDADTVALPLALWKATFPGVELERFAEWTEHNRKLEFLGSDEIIRLGVKYSFQDWMVSEWLDEYSVECESMLAALNRQARMTLRVNMRKTSREDCKVRLAREGIETADTKLSLAGLVASKRFNSRSSSTFADGWVEVQDEGSQIVSLLANPDSGAVVIDACAGAGGKSLHLAELMQDEGNLIAIDVDAGRLRELDRRARRAGIRCIKPVLAGDFSLDSFVGKADLVLIDAPCSGVGTIRRNPGFKWSVTEKLVSHYSEKQSELLAANSRYVKPGGRLVYSTCSLLRKENEDVVMKFLRGFSGFQPFDADAAGTRFGIPVNNGFLKLLPHLHDTDGFVISIMKSIY